MYASTTILNTLIAMQPGRKPMGYLKLIYLAQGWSMAFGRPVVADLPSLLEFGPTHLEAYDAMRWFGGLTIHGPVPAAGCTTPMAVPVSDTTTIDLLKQVVDKHGHLTDIQLSNLCHMAGTPWRNINESKAWKWRAGTRITEIELRDHFAAKLAAHEAAKQSSTLTETETVGKLDSGSAVERTV